MARKWTLEERKKHLREFYPEKRKKLGILIGVVALIIILAAGFSYAVKTQPDMGLALILAFALIIVVVCGVFIIDTYFVEIW